MVAQPISITIALHLYDGTPLYNMLTFAAATSTVPAKALMDLYTNDILNSQTLLKEFLCCVQPLEKSYVDSSAQCHINTTLQTITMLARYDKSHFYGWKQKHKMGHLSPTVHMIAFNNIEIYEKGFFPALYYKANTRYIQLAGAAAQISPKENKKKKEK